MASRANDLMGFLGQVMVPGEALPESVVKDAEGNLLRVFHGTGSTFEDYNPHVSREDNLFGPGYYTTENPQLASGYAKNARDRAMTDAERADFYTPGRVVPSYGGYDKVLAYNPGENGAPWSVRVIAADPNTGEPIPGAYERTHRTERTISPSRQVRPSYLDIRNPIDMDSPAPNPQLIDVLQTRLDDIKRENPKTRSGNDFIQTMTGMSYDDISGRLRLLSKDPQSMGTRVNMFGQTVPMTNNVPNTWMYERLRDLYGGADFANEALAKAGIDGITHIGGRRVGNVEHRVWIAFHPSQIIPEFELAQHYLPPAPSIVKGPSQ
jgi:hypothetical protein